MAESMSLLTDAAESLSDKHFRLYNIASRCNGDLNYPKKRFLKYLSVLLTANAALTGAAVVAFLFLPIFLPMPWAYLLAGGVLLFESLVFTKSTSFLCRLGKDWFIFAKLKRDVNKKIEEGLPNIKEYKRDGYTTSTSSDVLTIVSLVFKGHTYDEKKELGILIVADTKKGSLLTDNSGLFLKKLVATIADEKNYGDLLDDSAKQAALHLKKQGIIVLKPVLDSSKLDIPSGKELARLAIGKAAELAHKREGCCISSCLPCFSSGNPGKSA